MACYGQFHAGKMPPEQAKNEIEEFRKEMFNEKGPTGQGERILDHLNYSQAIDLVQVRPLRFSGN